MTLQTFRGKVNEDASTSKEVPAAKKRVDKKKYVAKVLADIGLEGAAALAITRGVHWTEGTSDLELRERIRAQIAVYAHAALSPLVTTNAGQKSLVILVGPAGVGKTTTAAKFAARAAAAGRSVSILSCDGYRVAAYEQLHRYAEILDVSFDMATTPEELANSVATSTTDFVIVDTAGRMSADADTPEWLRNAAFQALAEAARGRELNTLLCLPASVRAVDAEFLARGYATLKPTSLAITKLDETLVPSGLVHAAHATRLPVTLLCDGTHIHDNFHEATTDAILDHLLPMKKRAERAARAPARPSRKTRHTRIEA